MLAATSPRTAPEDRTWYILGRWHEFEGEGRANLIRILTIFAFYSVELANRHGFRLGVFEIPKIETVDRPFHLAVTGLAVAWVMTALAVHLCLRRHLFPASLKYLTSAADVALLTCVLAVSNGPRSPMLSGYFLILALAALRFSLPLVWFTTIASMLGYLALLGHAKWFTTRDLRVPRYHEVIFLLALALTGIILGQVLRSARKMALDYARRREASDGKGS